MIISATKRREVESKMLKKRRYETELPQTYRTKKYTHKLAAEAANIEREIWARLPIDAFNCGTGEDSGEFL